MAQQQHSSIRDDNLRLVLSDREADYIACGLHDAKAGLIGFLLIGLLGAGAFIGIVAYTLSPSSTSDDLVVIKGLVGILGLVLIVVIPFCLLKAVGALFRYLRFRSFRNDHDKFLKHYRRGS